MLSCKEVSRLASERLDRDLTLREKVAFYMHLMMCRLCLRYARHVAVLRRATDQLRLRRGFVADATLSKQARERIARKLREDLS
ncbi:MAG: zf-HC2 domain-containing protein [Gammaproteobacteria bacterium]|nr:MAG: zf-HC2 domain-containing protein [Gammaproteobacteria bacterium]